MFDNNFTDSELFFNLHMHICTFEFNIELIFSHKLLHIGKLTDLLKKDPEIKDVFFYLPGPLTTQNMSFKGGRRVMPG